MNKLLKVLAASALVATTLVGCGSKAKYSKVGFGMVIAPGDTTSTTVATVGLDGDGKIGYIDIDVIQTPNGKDETKTKKELKEEYAMKGNSGIGKEWYEQAAAFEEACKGKTLDEVAAIETEKKDDHHDSVPKAGTELAAGCTMNIGEFKAAIAKAGAAAVEVEAEKIGTGDTASWKADTKQKSTTFVSIALDKDGKIVWTNADVSQNPNGKDETKSKKELQGDYGMKGPSPIGKEWFEQVAAFEEYCKGKTADEVAKTETMDFHGGKAAKTGTELAAGCTITIDDLLSALAEAAANAQ